MKKIGIVTPWINLKNAEYEVIERMKIAANTIGAQIILSDNHGNILDEDHKLTDAKVNPKEFDMVLSLHYESPKYLDSFYYGILWNPPIYPIKFNSRFNAVENCNMYDAFLTYESKGILRHTKAFLYQCKGKVFRNFDFVASPATITHEPNLSDPKIFYCGINFERGRSDGRHSSVFKDLEKTGDLKIFGPEKFGSIKPWEGFDAYCGDIPFDGISMMSEINKCGVVLAIASDQHRRYDVITTRIYEAAAAGAVVIASASDFITKEFGDSVLTFDYQEDTSKKILEHFNWIKENKEEAKKKAQKLQDIFLKKFCMEKQLKTLLDEHKNIQEIAEKNTFSGDSQTVIDVILSWDKNSSEGLKQTINYINNQKYQSLRVIACFDNAILEECQNILNKELTKDIEVEVIGLDMFHKKPNQNEEGYKLLSSGMIVSEATNLIKSEYCTFIYSNTIWYSDHITTLKRTLEDHPNKKIAYSGCFVRKVGGDGIQKCETVNFKSLHFETLCKFDCRMTMATLMVKKDLIVSYGSGFLDPLDNFEFFPVAFFGLVNNSSIFSFKMTSGVIKNHHNYNFFMEPVFQIDYIKSLFRNNFTFPEVQKSQNIVNNIKPPLTNSIYFQDIHIGKYLIKKNKRTSRYLLSKLFNTKGYKKFKAIEKTLKL